MPRSTRVGLVAVSAQYSVGAGLSLSAGDVIQMVKIPAMVPYVYSVDDTIDIDVSTVSVGTITGGFHLKAIYSMDQS
jgi:hypothetical protein